MLFVPVPIFMPNPGALGSFTPSDLSGLYAWYDASDGATITLTSGRVSQWNDKSGNGKNATDPGASNVRPVVSAAAQNSLDVISFDSNDYMPMPTMAALTAGTLFCVAQKGSDPPTTAVSGPVFDTGTGTGAQWPANDSVIYDGNGSTVRKTVGDPTPSLASWFVVSVRSAASDYEFVLNGSSLLATSTNTVGFTATPYIGQNSSGRHFSGLVGEIVFYSVSLSMSDRQKVEGYLAWRWGIESVLPAGHPYKNAAP